MEFVGESAGGAKFFLEHTAREIMHYGRWDQCCTDVKIWKKLRTGSWQQRHPFAHHGKGGRRSQLKKGGLSCYRFACRFEENAL